MQCARETLLCAQTAVLCLSRVPVVERNRLLISMKNATCHYYVCTCKYSVALQQQWAAMAALLRPMCALTPRLEHWSFRSHFRYRTSPGACGVHTRNRRTPVRTVSMFVIVSYFGTVRTLGPRGEIELYLFCSCFFTPPRTCPCELSGTAVRTLALLHYDVRRDCCIAAVVFAHEDRFDARTRW